MSGRGISAGMGSPLESHRLDSTFANVVTQVKGRPVKFRYNAERRKLVYFNVFAHYVE
jgi:hypothetical protein